MDDKFVQERIAQLRMQKDVTARDMSLSLGQSNSYINHLETGRFSPSLQGLFYICDYFGISVKDFFDEGEENPQAINEIVEELKKMDAETLDNVRMIVKKLNTK